MNEKINCSLVISTFNWPAALKVCLKSVANQSILPNEVIIADDGSTQETIKLIEEIKKNFPVPIVHVWHADEGFQLAKIRNKAFAIAKNEYIIQVDGDLILHKHFIKDHLSLAKAKWFITGSRALLDDKITNTILKDEDLSHINAFSGKGSNFFNGLRIGFVRRLLAKRYKTSGKNKYYVKGCNMSFWRKDLIKVNGYNEVFTGWGREDSELAIRLINSGLNKGFIKMGGICYHLYHNEISREQYEKNTAMMDAAIKNKIIFCDDGLNKYLKDQSSIA